MPSNLKPNIPNIVNTAPKAGAVLSKLNSDMSANRIPYTGYNFRPISESIATRLRNNESILQLLPDLEVGIRIIVSSMLDPNGIIDNEIIYKAPDISLHSSVKSSIIDVISQHVESNFKISQKLPEIIKEALFTKGAYVEAIIPEASLDRLINKSSQYGLNNNQMYFNQEALNRAFDKNIVSTIFKDKTATWSLNQESFQSTYVMQKDVKLEPNKEIKLTEQDLNFEITDNYNLLFKSRFMLNNISKSHSSILKTNLENNSNQSSINYLDTLFRNNQSTGYTDTEFALREDETIRDSIGSPLVLKLPVESVIPIYVTNNPSKHVGYFVLIDIYGNPINLQDGLQEYDNQIGCQQGTHTTDVKTNIIARSRHGLYGNLKGVPQVENIEQLYSDVVDHMIKSKLRNSDFGELVSIKESADIYRVMLARSLASKGTKLLYLPVELVQYYAFDYRENGTGLSLLEKSLVLASMAGMLLYSNVKSAIQNAVPITDIKLEIDEHDTNPLSTGEQYLSELIRSNNVAFPLGITNPVSLHDWAIRSGFTLKIDSPYLPRLEVEREVRSGNKGEPIDENGDTYTKVINMIIKSFGLNPEMIEQAFKEDFAASVIAKNRLFAKRIIMLQNQFMPMVTEHIKKYIANDPVLKEEICNIVISNKKIIKNYIKSAKSDKQDIDIAKVKANELADYIYMMYRDSILVELPRPDFSDEDDKTKVFSAACSRIDEAVDQIYTSGMFDTQFIGDKAKEKLDTVKELVKAGAKHKWMVDNNYLDEVANWFVKQDDDTLKEPYFENNRDFVNRIMEEYMKYIKLYLPDVSKFAKEWDKIEEKVANQLGDSGGDDYESEGDDEDTSEDGSEDGSEGGDEFGDDDTMDEFDSDEDSGEDTGEDEGDTEETTEETEITEETTESETDTETTEDTKTTEE